MFKKRTQMRCCCIQTQNGSFAKGVNNSSTASKQDSSVIHVAKKQVSDIEVMLGENVISWTRFLVNLMMQILNSQNLDNVQRAK